MKVNLVWQGKLWRTNIFQGNATISAAFVPNVACCLSQVSGLGDEGYVWYERALSSYFWLCWMWHVTFHFQCVKRIWWVLMMLRFHVTTQLCLLCVLQVFSHEASQPKDDDYGLEACKFLDNTAFNDQGKNPFSRWGPYHRNDVPSHGQCRVISALLQRVLHTAQAVR